MRDRIFGFGHRRLNNLVLACGHWPIVGNFCWWVFGQWQYLCPSIPEGK